MMKSLLLSFLLFFGIANAETAIPEIGRVVDVAGILTPQQRQSLEAKSAAIQESTKTVLATLIIPSLDGESIFDYSMRVSEKWHPGIEGIDQGVILVISIADKKLQILTTRNTGQTLTDARSAHLLSEMVKHIKKTKGDFYGAIDGYLNDVVPYVQQEAVVEKPDNDNTILWWFFGIGIVIALGGIGYWMYMKRQARLERELQQKKSIQERIDRLNSRTSYVAPKRTTSSNGYLTPVPVSMPEPKKSSSSYSSSNDSSSSWSSYSSSNDSSSSWSSSSSSSNDSSSSWSSSSSSSYDGGGSSSSWD
jgi:uncharacterized membrane protein YgcG